MKATEERVRNERLLKLKHGEVVTGKILNDMLKVLGIKYNMFIDLDTKDSFANLTGWTFQHNYDNIDGNMTYTLSKL